jgi:hypothetical protein
MLRRFALLPLLAVLAALGCHAQIATSSHSITYSWNQPQATADWTGCTTALPCKYVVSTLKVSSTATTCPAATGSNYIPLNASAPTSSLTLTETQDAGSTVCGVVQTVQGAASSVASAPTTAPSTIPGNPLAPALNPPTVAVGTKPALAPAAQGSPDPVLAYREVRPALPDTAVANVRMIARVR